MCSAHDKSDNLLKQVLSSPDLRQIAYRFRYLRRWCANIIKGLFSMHLYQVDLADSFWCGYRTQWILKILDFDFHFILSTIRKYPPTVVTEIVRFLKHEAPNKTIPLDAYHNCLHRIKPFIQEEMYQELTTLDSHYEWVDESRDDSKLNILNEFVQNVPRLVQVRYSFARTYIALIATGFLLSCGFVLDSFATDYTVHLVSIDYAYMPVVVGIMMMLWHLFGTIGYILVEPFSFGWPPYDPRPLPLHNYLHVRCNGFADLSEVDKLKEIAGISEHYHNVLLFSGSDDSLGVSQMKSSGKRWLGFYHTLRLAIMPFLPILSSYLIIATLTIRWSLIHINENVDKGPIHLKGIAQAFALLWMVLSVLYYYRKRNTAAKIYGGYHSIIADRISGNFMIISPEFIGRAFERYTEHIRFDSFDETGALLGNQYLALNLIFTVLYLALIASIGGLP